MQRIALPPCRGLGELAAATGSLEALLLREQCPPPDQFIRRGEIGAAGHFFYGPRLPLSAGR
jgi:hypothetical protein